MTQPDRGPLPATPWSVSPIDPTQRRAQIIASSIDGTSE